MHAIVVKRKKKLPGDLSVLVYGLISVLVGVSLCALSFVLLYWKERQCESVLIGRDGRIPPGKLETPENADQS